MPTRLIGPTYACLAVMVMATLIFGGIRAQGQGVSLTKADDKSFELKTGEYVVKYAPLEAKRQEGWVSITRAGHDGSAIGTKLANGTHLNVTDAGDSEADIYKWPDTRKDTKIFHALTARETTDTIEIKIESERHWATFDSRLIAYKKNPGLVHWTVTATAKVDKAFCNGVEPDCQFMVNGQVRDADWKPQAHQALRYMVQRGPASGIAYFRDVPMESLVFYFEDFSSLNDLYRLTGCANPFDYPAAGNPGAVKMGDVSHEFQMSSPDGNNIQPSKPWTGEVKPYTDFGYHRPEAFRIPKGKTLVLADTYLYLQPQTATDNVAVCKGFVQMLADIYQYIYKPPVIATDWAGMVVPRMIKDIAREENGSLIQSKYYVPRAYVSYEHADTQLWTLVNLLHPLTLYVKKHPEQQEAAQLKAKLEETLPLFYDSDYKGFHNSPAPLQRNQFFTAVYVFEPAVMVSDLALLGNPVAQKMILGFRDRLLQMGQRFNYVFADMWWDDYSKQNNWYIFDATGCYVYLMMAINELNGGKDAECLAAAKAAAAKIKERCLDYMWEVNQSAAGVVGLEKLSKATGDPQYHELAYIPLANTLRWAWLWECDYGAGEKVTTFYGFCGCPAAATMAEFENHRVRFHFKQFEEMAGAGMTAPVRTLIGDAWRRGPTQSRFTLPPLLVEAGAQPYLAAEGNSETNCGQIRYDQMIPLEDFKGFWGTDLEWWNNNAKLGVVGQEIYGAGGPIWYALWQDETATQTSATAQPNWLATK